MNWNFLLLDLFLLIKLELQISKGVIKWLNIVSDLVNYVYNQLYTQWE